MATKAKKRKSYFVDERLLNRGKKALGVKTEAEIIRLSVERVADGKIREVYEKNPALSQTRKRGENLRWPWPLMKEKTPPRTAND